MGEAGDKGGALMTDEASSNHTPSSFAGTEIGGDHMSCISDDIGQGAIVDMTELRGAPRLGVGAAHMTSVEPMLSNREVESSPLDLVPFSPMSESQARLLREDDMHFQVVNSIALGIQLAAAGKSDYLFRHMNIFKIFDDHVHADANFTMNLISFVGNSPQHLPNSRNNILATIYYMMSIFHQPPSTTTFDVTFAQTNSRTWQINYVGTGWNIVPNMNVPSGGTKFESALALYDSRPNLFSYASVSRGHEVWGADVDSFFSPACGWNTGWNQRHGRQMGTIVMSFGEDGKIVRWEGSEDRVEDVKYNVLTRTSPLVEKSGKEGGRVDIGNDAM
jgi:hypothetical protein